MEERDPLPLRADPRGLIDQADPGGAAAREGAVEVVDVEAEVMDPRAARGEELPDRGVRDGRLEELDQRFSRGQSDDARAIGIVERDLREAQQFLIER